MIDAALILDLDDTIFQTRSMDKKLFEPFFTHLTASLRGDFSDQVIEAIINDLWQNTWDVVIRKYGIPRPIILKSIQVLNDLELDLNISPYPDYAFIKDLQCPKFLVTTSLTTLQVKKIKALDIEQDFLKIVINDPFKESKTKLDIFRELMHEFKLVPGKTYVIGDNPDSEILAGNALNMVTVQILRNNTIKGDHANYFIKSFNELADILKHETGRA